MDQKRLLISGYKKFIILSLVLMMFSLSCEKKDEFSFPDKPITLIVYTGPGGLIDITARKFVDVAEKYSDATFVVENKAGSGGIVALKNLLQQPSDGYTLLASTKSNISKIISTGADTFIEDINWAAMMMADPECLITYKQNSVNTWEDIFRDAKEKDGDQLWVGPANGGLDHVTALKIWDKAGIKAKWIPFKSGGKAKAALLGNQGVVYVGNPREVLGNDNLEIAAVSSKTRLPQFPDVPTFTELGLEGLENEFMWRGFVFKNGTPPSVLAWYEELFEKVANDTEWKEYWEKGGIDASYVSTEEFTKIVETDKQDFLHYLSKLNIINTKTDNFISRLTTGKALAILVSVFVLLFLLVCIIVNRSKNSNWLSEILIPVFFILISILFYLLSFNFPSNETIGPDIVPRLWIYLLIPLNVLLIIQTFIQKRAVKESKSSLRSVLRFIALLIVYLLGIYYIGYFISTFLFIYAGISLLGYKNVKTKLIISICWLIFSYLIFYKLLFVPLPQGMIIEMIF